MAMTNDVRLIGYAGISAKIKTTRNGNSICFLPIYTEHWGYTNGNRETFKETHECLFSGKNAERAHKMIMKGTQVYIKGSLHYFLPTNSEIKSKRHNLNYDAHVNTTLTVQLTGLKKRRKQTKETRRQNGEAL